MKPKAGYTLVTMLAAIAVIGMTAAAVSNVLLNLSRNQGRASASLARMRTDTAIASAFVDAVPAGANYSTLSGGVGHLQLDCPGGPCEANVLSSHGRFVLALTHPGAGTETIDLAGPVQFQYQTTAGFSDQWPAQTPNASLSGIALVTHEAEGLRPLAVVRVRQRQPRDCEYDAVIRDCRRTNP